MTAGNYDIARPCDLPEACPVAAACLPQSPMGPGGSRVPCLEMAHAHNDKMRLCNDLEQIADSLPDRVDRRLCLIVAAKIMPLLKGSHTYEEDYIFPAFAASTISPSSGHASVRRLKAEHIEDECAAQDLADALLPIGNGVAIKNPEALGFMLRAFFETMRRHIAFEREHILPVLAREI